MCIHVGYVHMYDLCMCGACVMCGVCVRSCIAHTCDLRHGRHEFHLTGVRWGGLQLVLGEVPIDTASQLQHTLIQSLPGEQILPIFNSNQTNKKMNSHFYHSTITPITATYLWIKA